jgi:AcrR family transcriptional regulator
MALDDQPSRTYSSPLRENQAQRTRDLILDALTELLATHRVDEVSTKQIAARAGVSQPTVYRHFPDRAALVHGLTDRIERMIAASGIPEPQTLEDWIEGIEHRVPSNRRTRGPGDRRSGTQRGSSPVEPGESRPNRQHHARRSTIVSRTRRSRPPSRCRARPHIHLGPDVAAHA